MFNYMQNGIHSGHVQTGNQDPFCLVKNGTGRCQSFPSVSNAQSVHMLGSLKSYGLQERHLMLCFLEACYQHWQPSWSVRKSLVVLIAVMLTNPNGALGSLDYKKEERRVLAVKSREAAPKFGNPERQ